MRTGHTSTTCTHPCAGFVDMTGVLPGWSCRPGCHGVWFFRNPKHARRLTEAPLPPCSGPLPLDAPMRRLVDDLVTVVEARTAESVSRWTSSVATLSNYRDVQDFVLPYGSLRQ